MQIVCLDMEGVLVPEIWIAFAERTGIPELRRTTRDEPDYDKLMKFRLDLLAEKMALPECDPDNLVVIFQSGAYGATASPRGFLSHPDLVEILL